MVAQYYRDPNSGQFVLIPTGANPVVPNEVAIQAAEPTDPAVEIWVDTDDDTGQSGGTPIGAIIAFGGNIAPFGWHLCDGSAHGSAALQAVIGGINTPDLRRRFIIGADAAYPPLSIGGAATHTHPLSSAGQAAVAIGTVASPNVFINRVTSPSWTATHQAGFPTTPAGSSTAQALGAGLTGNTDAGSTLPPYYSLVYIIKKA